nr:XRE family transcriptional regulator [Flavimaribacter sediminis]
MIWKQSVFDLNRRNTNIRKESISNFCRYSIFFVNRRIQDNSYNLPSIGNSIFDENRYICGMTEQLKRIRKSRGLSQSDVADALGIVVANYNRLERGKVELTLSRMKELAILLKCEPVDLITNKTHTRFVKVRSSIEADQWMKHTEWPEDQWYEITVPDDAELQTYSLNAAEVRGPSMNKKFPHGSVLVYSEAGDNPLQLEANASYIIETRRSDGMKEATAKTAITDNSGKFWLMPESTDPRHQQPIELENTIAGQVSILGKVRYSLRRET